MFERQGGGGAEIVTPPNDWTWCGYVDEIV